MGPPLYMQALKPPGGFYWVRGMVRDLFGLPAWAEWAVNT